MKKLKQPIILVLAVLSAIIAAVCALFGVTGKVYAVNYSDPYYYEFSNYRITYDVNADRTMSVTVDMGVDYLGYDSTGLLYDIPVNAGDRVANIKACLLSGGIDGPEVYLTYKVKNEENNLITVDMDDYSNKTGITRYYRLRYDYVMTSPSAEEKRDDKIFLNAVGGGFNRMSNVQITINLPDGALTDGIICADHSSSDFTVSGSKVTMNLDYLPARTAVTFTLPFEAGTLSTKPDMTSYYVIIAACALLAVLVIVKLLRFNKDGLTPVTNVEAPDDLDPLAMGKLIDNRVNRSDVTSLIYYWADKGYIKINMGDDALKNDGISTVIGNDVELIRIYKSLPQQSPKYQKIMYDRLFKSGDTVKISSLANSFYPTVEAVSKAVNVESGKLYDGTSMGIAVLFALLAALFMGGVPIILGLIRISYKFFNVFPLLMIVPSFVIFALGQSIRYNRLKLNKTKLTLCYAGLVLLALLFVGLYVLLVPSYIIEALPKFLLGIAGFAIVIIATTIISRTEAYVKKLNKIVGFRNFILYAEKDKLELLLEQNPEFYYHVLPYAIVLGVTDVWEKKFDALTVAPPAWVTNRYSSDVFSFVIFNRALRNMNINMTSTFISRPSSGSYSGGGFGGGSFGGFSGGGHGGGGARGR